LGDRNIEEFYQKGWLTDASKIFSLKEDRWFELPNMEGWGAKSATKLFDAI